MTPTAYGNHDVIALEITTKTAIKWQFCHSPAGREIRNYFAGRELGRDRGVGYDNSSELLN